MEKFKCPIMEKCPIFQKGVFHNEMVGVMYRTLYCISSDKKYLECKRYLALQKFGKPVPENILPNSTLTIDEIGKKMGAI